ncbi:MAG: hypothetical protein ACJAZX_000422 [Rickettsiales bacterium]|jgi:hypothetical protein
MEENINFTQVKISGTGYQADGMFIPKERANRHYASLTKWIENGGIVESEFNVDEIKQQEIQKIKSQAATKITAKYSEIDQRNILMSQNKVDILAMHNFIKQIRDGSNALEVELDGEELQEIAPKSGILGVFRKVLQKSN